MIGTKVPKMQPQMGEKQILMEYYIQNDKCLNNLEILSYKYFNNIRRNIS